MLRLSLGSENCLGKFSIGEKLLNQGVSSELHDSPLEPATSYVVIQDSESGIQRVQD